MAMEYLQAEFNKAKDEFRRSFEGRILVGREGLGGKVLYTITDLTLEDLKLLVDTGRYGKVVYVGRIKFDWEKPTLEEVDLSQVKYKSFKLTEKGKRLMQQKREERRRKYGLRGPNESLK
ncbi:MAG: hypothetical protein QXP77_03790 [Candidatus Aenigmatarchaeota archaeon]